MRSWARLEELQAHARPGHPDPDALREAVELSSSAQAVAEAEGDAQPTTQRPPRSPEIAAEVAEAEEAAADAAPQSSTQVSSNGHSNGNGHAEAPGNFLGAGPLLEDLASRSARWATSPSRVGVEDAVGRIGATDVSVERFSEGRATFSMRL